MSEEEITPIDELCYDLSHKQVLSNDGVVRCLDCNLSKISAAHQLLEPVKPVDEWKGIDRIGEAKGSFYNVEVLFEDGSIVDYMRNDWPFSVSVGWRFKNAAYVKPVEGEKMIVKEDMICPLTKLHCDDECCTVGSTCNLSGDGISSPVKPSIQSGVEDAANEYAEKFRFINERIGWFEEKANGFKAGAEWQAQQVKQPVMQWVKATSETFENEDWQWVHYRYAKDKAKLEAYVWEVKEGYLQKLGGTGTLPFCEIEFLEEAPIQ